MSLISWATVEDNCTIIVNMVQMNCNASFTPLFTLHIQTHLTVSCWHSKVQIDAYQMTTSKCQVLWICQADGASLEEDDKISVPWNELGTLLTAKKINKYLLCRSILCGWLWAHRAARCAADGIIKIDYCTWRWKGRSASGSFCVLSEWFEKIGSKCSSNHKIDSCLRVSSQGLPPKLRVLGSSVLIRNFHECSKCKWCFLLW